MKHVFTNPAPAKTESDDVMYFPFKPENISKLSKFFRENGFRTDPNFRDGNKLYMAMLQSEPGIIFVGKAVFSSYREVSWATFFNPQKEGWTKAMPLSTFEDVYARVMEGVAPYQEIVTVICESRVESEAIQRFLCANVSKLA